MSERTELADGGHKTPQPNGLLFKELTNRSALSLGNAGIAFALTIGAVVLVPFELWTWATEGGAVPWAALYLPLGAYGTWQGVAISEEWSRPRQRRLERVGMGLAAFFGVLFVDGTYVWWWRNGGALLPALSLLSTIGLVVRTRRRGTAAPHAV